MVDTDESWLTFLGGRVGLARALARINAARERGEDDAEPADLAPLWAAAARRLAVYGTLAPGEVNHGMLSSVAGSWWPGTVRGRLVTVGWGAAHGFPALELDEEATAVRVQVFAAPDLPRHWPRLDEFEGAEYVRVLVPVATPEGGLLVSNLYAARRSLTAR